MLPYQAVWLRKKDPSVFVCSPYIVLFRLTLTVGHQCVQEFALFCLFCLGKSISQVVLYRRNVIVGLTHAINKRNQLRIVYCFQQ